MRHVQCHLPIMPTTSRQCRYALIHLPIEWRHVRWLTCSACHAGYLGDLRKAAIKLHTREQMGSKKDKAQAAEEAQERPKV